MNHISIVTRMIRFHKPAKTSRNVFTEREIHYLIWEDGHGAIGIGEAAPLHGLSIDDVGHYREILSETVQHINEGTDWRELDLIPYPSIRFGLEVAEIDLRYKGRFIISDNSFVKGEAIPINGLIWMDEIDAMRRSVDEKVSAGFDVIKLKVGAHDFDAECRLLEDIRKHFPPGKISLRLDANGAFPASDALVMIKELSRFDIHSIEQPIKAGQMDHMAHLCRDSKIPVALDEELIGINVYEDGAAFMKALRPAFLIIKPNLIGGLAASDAWVRLATENNSGWWATSALETNVGLNAIAQWVSTYSPRIPQGLGTGSLYVNNIGSPLEVTGGYLRYNKNKGWDKIEIPAND